ncbi:small acid-soluble spore protein H [Bacillus sp. Marseille-P3661]|uniref:small acid-soluble spore protein H n=1 Tax=Bacillus sp. Marseille-P3661 TaxID=1936234 RepID=UPI000C8301D4|nr:small acid-soluble spore protein H [Bacillus sp. Marseille-P3661]
MNMQRAKEISESPEMVNVTYDGTPIYIQHVDEETETARIFPLNEPQNERYVPLNGLEEH